MSKVAASWRSRCTLDSRSVTTTALARGYDSTSPPGVTNGCRMFAISSASTCRTWKISMTKSSSRRASVAALPRGMMARVLASATGRIW
jgi:hypothetical protein